jgi:hypothetical protein
MTFSLHVRFPYHDESIVSELSVRDGFRVFHLLGHQGVALQDSEILKFQMIKDPFSHRHQIARGCNFINIFSVFSNYHHRPIQVIFSFSLFTKFVCNVIIDKFVWDNDISRGCDSGCDRGCDIGCDSGCDSDCDCVGGCDSGCDRGYDSGCDRGYDNGCDSVCDSGCDSDCGCDCDCESRCCDSTEAMLALAHELNFAYKIKIANNLTKEGSSEKVNRALFSNKNDVILRIFYCLNFMAVFIINIFFTKQKFLL